LPDHPDFADAPRRLVKLETRPAADFAEFDRWLRRLRDARLARPVLLVDEFEALLEPRYAEGFPAPQFFDGLNALQTADLLALVVASREPLVDEFARHVRARTSNFARYLVPVTLEELDDEAADRVVLPLLDHGCGLGEMQAARRWAGNHPCRLQCAGEAWYWAKCWRKDAVWAERHYRKLARQNCHVPDGHARAWGWVPLLALAAVLGLLGYLVGPERIGGAIQGFGEKLDQWAAWLLGCGALVGVFGIVTGHVSVPRIREIIERLKRWLS
jgi:hypothetical protein